MDYDAAISYDTEILYNSGDAPEPPAPDLAMSSVLIQQSRRLFMEDEEIIIL